jgi:hypothetical protein
MNRLSPVTSKSAREGRIKTGDSKVQPATLRCFIHIRFLDASKGLLNFSMPAGTIASANASSKAS